LECESGLFFKIWKTLEMETWNLSLSDYASIGGDTMKKLKKDLECGNGTNLCVKASPCRG
jgi:hypothetical protein